jgi:nucleotide sugar dehydrogenase
VKTEDELATVAVMGQGYVGLPLAMRAVDVGFNVVGFDLDKTKISALAAAESYVDDVTDGDLEVALATGRFHPTDAVIDLDGFDVAVIAVPTPLREGIPDISYIESASRMLGSRLRPGALVILESTTFPGTTEEVVGPILEAESGLVPVGTFCSASRRSGSTPETRSGPSKRLPRWCPVSTMCRWPRYRPSTTVWWPPRCR